jgi:hypothetical protein
LNFLQQDLDKVENDSVLWIAYPKVKSKFKTEINRDILWKIDEEFNITTVSTISIDVIWSG